MATKINFQEHLIGTGSNLQTVEFAEILKEIKATNLYLTESNLGKLRLSVESAHKDSEGNPLRLVIALGPTVALTETDPMEQIKEVVNNYVIYTGTTDKHNNTIRREDGTVVRWFAFGKKSDALTPAVKVSVADLMASMKSGAVGAKA